MFDRCYTNYIPDITERYPEGMRGVDTCSGYEPPYDEDPYDDLPEPEPRKLKVGDLLRDIEFDGGITEYRIIKFNKARTKAYVSETWFNVDGTGKRRPNWRDIKVYDDGEESIVMG